jgi:citronellol/citronellal dehydrogenase
MTSRTLAGKTLFITGASRGIGKAIALRAARDGANIAIVAKTTDPHPTLPGTVYTARDEVIAAGGQALACVADVRSEEQIAAAVDATVKTFGGIDILINNASAISLTNTDDTPLKRFDLMHGVNVRATFLSSKLCLPHLRKSPHAHILTLSPPLTLKGEWFGPHLAYSLSKYGMSLCTLGLSHELRADGIAVNSLWPKTLIATAAVAHMTNGATLVEHARLPAIVADAAHHILTTTDLSITGEFLIDEHVLRASGVSDFEAYASTPGNTPSLDLFLEP